MSNLKGSYDDSYLLPTNKKERLQAHQRDAYYNVLHAFNAEDLDFSEERVTIVKDLIKEWNITTQIHRMMDNRVKDEPLYQYNLRKEEEKPPLAKCIFDDPLLLVEERIKIRLPDENEFITFYVNDYNETEGTHQLVSPFSLKTADEDPCEWIDTKLFPEEDIEWGKEPHESPEQPRRRKRKQGINFYKEAILNAARKAKEAGQLNEAQANANAVVIA